MSRHASKAIGLSITIKEKPFTLLPSDLQVLRPEDVHRVLDRSGLGADAKRAFLESMGEPIVLDLQAEFPEEITDEHDDERVLPYHFAGQQQMLLIGHPWGWERRTSCESTWRPADI
jgi:hypothetical protein